MIFYFPNRAAPTTTVTIAPIESSPYNRSKKLRQSKQIAPSGKVRTYKLGNYEEFIQLAIINLSNANRSTLINFIENIVIISKYTFDITDDNNIQHDTVRFFFDLIKWENIRSDQNRMNLLLKVDL